MFAQIVSMLLGLALVICLGVAVKLVVFPKKNVPPKKVG